MEYDVLGRADFVLAQHGDIASLAVIRSEELSDPLTAIFLDRVFG